MSRFGHVRAGVRGRGLIKFSVDYYKLEHGTVGLTFPCYQSSLAPGQVTQHKGKRKIQDGSQT